MDIYIYYRVAGHNVAALQARVFAMQRDLSNRHAIQAALKHRPEIQGEMHTTMEVYLAVPENFGQLLDEAVSSHGLTSLIDGPRHTERFLDVIECA